MYRKVQESELIEMIPQICILTIQGQYPEYRTFPVFLHSEFPSGDTAGYRCQAWWLAGGQHS